MDLTGNDCKITFAALARATLAAPKPASGTVLAFLPVEVEHPTWMAGGGGPPEVFLASPRKAA